MKSRALPFFPMHSLAVSTHQIYTEQIYIRSVTMRDWFVRIDFHSFNEELWFWEVGPACSCVTCFVFNPRTGRTTIRHNRCLPVSATLFSCFHREKWETQNWQKTSSSISPAKCTLVSWSQIKLFILTNNDNARYQENVWGLSGKI